jgi:hemerythrin-like domain-containing protein
MNRPTAILNQEHRTIEKLLDGLEQFALATLRTGALDFGTARRFVAVLEEFVEGRHHDKEEALLLPLVERRGVPGKLFRLACAVEDSEHEPETVRELELRCDDAERGDRGACTEFARCALGYCGRMRRHMTKEDLVLFPIAEAALLDTDRAALLEAFGRLDESDSARAGRERIRLLLRQPIDEPSAEPVVVRR